MASGYGGSYMAFTDDDDDEELVKAVSQTDLDFLNDDESLALSLQWEEINNSNQSTNNVKRDKNNDNGDDDDDDEETKKSTTFIIENWDSLADQDGFEVMVSPGKPKYNESLSSSLALSDPQWEMIDPTPNIHTLFIEFDQRFFWGKLGSVEIGWSKRMTTCAGICYYSGRRSGYCRIGLSEPLLKLRARKELVETLLHEMIHAYLFVTNNNKDHDGHGGEFHKHMYRINKETGLAISVYHTFHDEVAHYKRHWWRCDGPCRNRPPYHGYVKRASNRAPSKTDFWWADHQRTCGGNYIKVKEPEEYTEKQLKKKNKQAASTSSSQTKTAKPKNGKEVPIKDIRGFLSGSVGSSQSQPTLSQISKPTPKPSQPTSDKSAVSSNSNSNNKDIRQLFGNSQPVERNSSPSPSVPLSPPPITQQTSITAKSLSPPKHTFSDVVMNSGEMLRKLIGQNRRLPEPEKSAQVPTKNKETAAATTSTSAVVVVDDSDSESEVSSGSAVVFTGSEKSVACPVCGIRVSETSINLHLDVCLSC